MENIGKPKTPYPHLINNKKEEQGLMKRFFATKG